MWDLRRSSAMRRSHRALAFGYPSTSHLAESAGPDPQPLGHLRPHRPAQDHLRIRSAPAGPSAPPAALAPPPLPRIPFPSGGTLTAGPSSLTSTVSIPACRATRTVAWAA